MASPDVNRALRGLPPSLYGILDWKLAAGRGEPIPVVVFPTIRRTGDFQRRKCPVTLNLVTDLRLLPLREIACTVAFDCTYLRFSLHVHVTRDPSRHAQRRALNHFVTYNRNMRRRVSSCQKNFFPLQFPLILQGGRFHPKLSGRYTANRAKEILVDAILI